jgi:predicted short-subunit dehydrogenase-like oxidoreductase (DUF2520 family)
MPDHPSSDSPRLAIIGAGRLGSVLAISLRRRGWSVAALFDREAGKARALAERLDADLDQESAEAAVARAGAVFLTVSDDEIAPLAARLAGIPAVAGRIFFHTSGAQTAEVLGPLAGAGAEVGTLHPLQTLADVETGLGLITDIYWTVDGSPAAVGLAEHLVDSLEGRLLRVPAQGRVLYHAAAVTASNYLVALADEASRLLEGAGVDREHALRALLPLMEGTILNLKRQDAIRALTGPVARGDAATVERHLAALDASRPEAARLYRLLGERCLTLAEARGLAPGLVESIRRALAGPESKRS